MVKDIIVIYRKSETILILISLKRYFSHLETSILNLSLRHCNSWPLPLPRTVGLVCVCVCVGGGGGGGGNQDVITIQRSTMTPLQYLISVSVLAGGMGQWLQMHFTLTTRKQI